MKRPQQTRLNWIAPKVCAAVGAAIALAALTTPVMACRGLPFERRILLDAIPPAAEKSEVIARVEILDVHIRQLPELRAFTVARARILQSIRGTTDGQIIEIFAQASSCGGGLDHSTVGHQGFIAGRFYQYAGETFFRGSWNNLQIGKF
jgi:hypothetical protein